MLFREHECGPYRIYTGTIEGKQRDGYVADLIIVQFGSVDRPREVFREEEIFCGHRWLNQEDALSAARARGIDQVLKMNGMRPTSAPSIHREQ
jgi:hypothetical protein